MDWEKQLTIVASLLRQLEGGGGEAGKGTPPNDDNDDCGMGLFRENLLEGVFLVDFDEGGWLGGRRGWRPEGRRQQIKSLFLPVTSLMAPFPIGDGAEEGE
jgi:hypothetical protein